MGSTEATRAYCPTCERDRPIKKTVPWQPDLCTACGTDLD